MARLLLTVHGPASGSELFTEHTSLAFLPVLDGRASVRRLARLWGLVYVGNLVGGVVFVALLKYGHVVRDAGTDATAGGTGVAEDADEHEDHRRDEPHPS